MADFSQEIKDLQSISTLAADIGKRLTNENAEPGLRAPGSTELWLIGETAARLAADLQGYSQPVGEPGKMQNAASFDLAEEQRRLWKRE
jgi:hypothetical protein